MKQKRSLIWFFILIQSITVSYSQKELEVINLDTIGDDYFYYSGGEIKAESFIHPQNGHSLHPDSLLKQFYPGAFYRYPFSESDTLSVVLWYCNDATPELMMINEYNEDTLTFIDTILYDTRLLMCQPFTKSPNQHFAWVAFNTTSAQVDFLLTGRFCSGLLSLAYLKQTDNQWSVVDFNKAIGYHGMFCKSPAPEIIEYKKGTFGLQLIDYNGGAGGPYFGSLSLFDIMDSTITELISIPLSHLSETLKCGWESKIEMSDSLKSNEIMIITEGKIDKKEFTEECGDLDILPNEIIKALSKKREFKFSIQRIYKLTNNKYELTNTHFKIL